MSYQAIAFPIFQPAMRIIAAISNSFPAVIETTFPHQYFTGTIVRLYIPNGFGMVQANKLQGTIAVIDPETFAIDIDTTLFDTFIVPMFLGATSGPPFGGNFFGVDPLPNAQVGNTFVVYTQIFTIVTLNGAMQTNGPGSGSFVDGYVTIINSYPLYDVYFIPISFPFNQQQPSCVPIGEDNDTLKAAVKNVLPYSM